MTNIISEFCNECGNSVKFGTGLFVNRVFDFNSETDRKEFGKLFPKGDFICSLCEENINKEVDKFETENAKITN